VEDHAVVLEAQAAGEFREAGIRAGGLALGDQSGDLLVEQVRVLDIALVEPEVDLERLVRDPL
jgi:hypothetical protein